MVIKKTDEWLNKLVSDNPKATTEEGMKNVSKNVHVEISEDFQKNQETKESDLEKIEKINAEVVKKRSDSELFPESLMYKVGEKYYIPATWPMHEEIEITDTETPILVTRHGTPLVEVDPKEFNWGQSSGSETVFSCKMSDLFTEVKPEYFYENVVDQNGNTLFNMSSPFIRIDKKKEDLLGTRQRIQNSYKGDTPLSKVVA